MTVAQMDIGYEMAKVFPKFHERVSVSQEGPPYVGSVPWTPHPFPNMPCSSPNNGPGAGASHATERRNPLSRKGLGVLEVVNILGLIGPRDLPSQCRAVPMEGQSQFCASVK